VTAPPGGNDGSDADAGSSDDARDQEPEPDALAGDPDTSNASAGDPSAEAGDPDTSTDEQDAEDDDPDTATDEPESETDSPDTATDEPEAETDDPDPGTDEEVDDTEVDFGWVMQLTFVATILLGVPVVAGLSAFVPLPTWESRVGFAVRVGALIWILVALSVYGYARLERSGSAE